MAVKRFYRSRTDRMIWGVCGGLARYFEIDPVIVRIIAILTIFLGFAGVLAYIILAIVVPLESSGATEPEEVMKENVREMKETATQLGQDIRSTFKRKASPTDESAQSTQRARDILGIVLIIAGVLFLLAAFGGFWWLNWRYAWPAVLVLIGLLILLTARRRK